MSILFVAQWIQATPLAQAIGRSAWMFPAAETIHVIAIALVVGSIAIVDLRLLGLAWRHRAVTDVTREILPWTWGSFVIAAMAGSVMFASAAAKYATDLPFQLKMLLLLLAGANMLSFHYLTYPHVARWDRDVPTPPAAKFAGALSLLFWIAIVSCGRLVSFSIEDQFGPPGARIDEPQLLASVTDKTSGPARQPFLLVVGISERIPICWTA